jgi:hypothetical protein
MGWRWRSDGGTPDHRKSLLVHIFLYHNGSYLADTYVENPFA